MKVTRCNRSEISISSFQRGREEEFKTLKNTCNTKEEDVWPLDGNWLKFYLSSLLGRILISKSPGDFQLRPELLYALYLSRIHYKKLQRSVTRFTFLILDLITDLRTERKALLPAISNAEGNHRLLPVSRVPCLFLSFVFPNGPVAAIPSCLSSLFWETCKLPQRNISPWVSLRVEYTYTYIYLFSRYQSSKNTFPLNYSAIYLKEDEIPLWKQSFFWRDSLLTPSGPSIF